jgi:predicted transcriptional regulator
VASSSEEVSAVVSRRPLGSLESEVLEVLWKSDEPLTPSEVLGRLDADLAYTTVMTVLGRLWQKGLADRAKVGRAFAYSAVLSEADLSADRMRKALDASSDKVATMSHFLDGLDSGQQYELRRMLEDRSQ